MNSNPILFEQYRQQSGPEYTDPSSMPEILSAEELRDDQQKKQMEAIRKKDEERQRQKAEKQKELDEEQAAEQRVEGSQFSVAEDSRREFQSGRDAPPDPNMSALETGALETTAAVTLAATGKPLVDLAMDAVGLIPGGAPIDDAYDQFGFDAKASPIAKQVYDVLGVIVPTVVGTMTLGPKGGEAAFKLSGGSAIARGIGRVVTGAGVDVAVTGISDYSERDEGVVNALDDFLDWTGNPLGMNIPEAMKIHDDMSPEVRRQRLMLEAGVFAVVADALGYVLSRGRRTLEWFKPKDDQAKIYKAEQSLINPDPYSVGATARLDDEISQVEIASMPRGRGGASQPLVDELEASQLQVNLGPARGAGGSFDSAPTISAPDPSTLAKQESIRKASIKALRQQKDEIIEETIDKGFSKASDDPLESYVARQDASRDWQTDSMAARAMIDDPELNRFNADVQPNLADSKSTVQFSQPAAAVARNAADLAAIEKGVAKGVPAPVVTAPMLDEGIRPGGPGSRKIILDIANENTGKFDAFVNNNRITYKESKEVGMKKLLPKMIEMDADELKSFFLNRQESRTLVDGFTVNMMKGPDSERTAIALQVLSHMYLGEDAVETSARVMKTLGYEVEALSEAMSKFKGSIDADKVSDVIHDKLAFLFEEYAINKYVAGWTLANQRFWQKLKRGVGLKKSDEQVIQELTDGIAKATEGAKAQTAVYMKLRQENPALARALAMAYDYTNGDIQTLRQLRMFGLKQINPFSALVNLKGDPTAFAEVFKAVRYNAAFNGKSSLKALFGNSAGLIASPIEYMWSAVGPAVFGNFKPLRAGLYAYGSFFSTQSQALADAYQMWKKAVKDPESVMKYMRKDLRQPDDTVYDILEATIKTDKDVGRVGEAAGKQFVLWGRRLSLNPILRWGNNAFLSIDTYTNTLVATANSRFRAFDEILESKQLMTPELLDAAAERHYKDMFDSNGLIKDSWLRHTSGEIALNADNKIADVITELTRKVPALTPFFFIPTTSMNWLRRSISYVPVVNMLDTRTQKILYSQINKDKNSISDALLAYGIVMDEEPQAMMIYNNLVREVHGRWSMGAGLASATLAYAMGGNIIGNMPRNKQDQRFWRKNKIKPHTINIGGYFVSFAGIPILDPILTIVGDIARYSNDVGQKSINDTMQDIGWTFAQTFTANSPMQGIEELVNLMAGDRGAAWQRMIAREVALTNPTAGMTGVIANAIDNSAKDMYNDWRKYLFNRLPGLNTTLPEIPDVWAGGPIDAQHPILRIFNAVSPVPVSEGPEPWRKWLLSTGFNGTPSLRYATDSTYEYSGEEREIIYGKMGKMGLWKVPDRMSKSEYYNDFLDQMRDERSEEFTDQLKYILGQRYGDNAVDPKQIDLREQQGELYEELRKTLNDAKRIAEDEAFEEGLINEQTILGSQIAERLLKYGDIRGARKARDITLGKNPDEN